MPKRDKSKKFKADLDIYKKNGSYDRAKIDKIEIEKINFAYENAISLIKDIKDKIKAVETKFAWLFGLIVGTVALSRFTEIESISKIYENKEILAVVIIFIFFIFLIIARRLIVSRYAHSPHSEPKNILNREIFKSDIKLIKITATERLQKIIEENQIALRRLAIDFNFCFFCVIFLSIIFALITNYNG